MAAISGQRAVRGRRALRWAALGGVIGPILFAALVIAAGVFYDGYSHVSQKVSELGGEGAEYAVLQNLNFAILGVLILGFSWALARAVGPSYLGPALIGYFGLVALAHSWIPCDLGCKGETALGLLHNVTGLTGFAATAVGMLVLARRWRRDPTWQSYTGFTWGALWVAVAGLIWFVITQAADLQSLAGLAQRTFSGTLLLWIAATAWKLHSLLRPDTTSRDFVAAVAPHR